MLTRKEVKMLSQYLGLPVKVIRKGEKEFEGTYFIMEYRAKAKLDEAKKLFINALKKPIKKMQKKIKKALLGIVK
jgi:hypothetical protein